MAQLAFGIGPIFVLARVIVEIALHAVDGAGLGIADEGHGEKVGIVGQLAQREAEPIHAFVEVKSVGQMGDKASPICAVICEHLSRSLGIAPDHVYIELADTTAPMWGWNSKTLA
ncbi:MAG: hypothetical protein HC926_00395 [Synechococcaceae cyanobacterium SM2_3_60]|nr:hypothetical protein [Synechococcaceae cyanobacterium SM2_3_60]